VLEGAWTTIRAGRALVWWRRPGRRPALRLDRPVLSVFIPVSGRSKRVQFVVLIVVLSTASNASVN
jgi:hypothetical protein